MMRRFKIVSILVVFGMMLLFVGAIIGHDQKADALLNRQITQAGAYLQSNELTDWSVFALSRAGMLVSGNSYLKEIESYVTKSKGKWNNPADIERLIIVLHTLGHNPTRIAGYNLMDILSKDSQVPAKGNMSVIFGLIALDSGRSPLLPHESKMRDVLLQTLLDSSNPDKGWPYAAGDTSSIDVTAMAITALAPYYELNTLVKPIVDQAVAWLSSKQLPNGGFAELGETSESIAQVIIALTSLGIDPQSRAFTKSNNLLQRLAQYQTTDGGFAHSIGSQSYQISTEQALQALTAYRMWLQQQGSLFYKVSVSTQVSITVEGSQSTLSLGVVEASTALAALRNLATNENLQLVVTDSVSGPYVSSIQGIQEKGNDRWLFAIKRQDAWIHPQGGMADFNLEPMDHLYVYFGGSTKLTQQIIITPEQPKVNQAFTIRVLQTEWDTLLNQAVTTPAQGVLVTVAQQSVLSNELGEASFTGVSSVGQAVAIVTGYQQDAAPLILKAMRTFKVASKQVQVRITIEGSRGSLASETVTAISGVDALEQVARKSKLMLTVEDSSYGKYVTRVGNDEETDTDGWMFAIQRGGTWVYPDTGIEDYDLRPNDHVYVYYGYATAYIHDIQLSQADPTNKQPMQIRVTQESWDSTLMKAIVTPAVGVQVQVANQTHTTNSDGSITISEGLPAGHYTIVVTGYQAKGSPSVLRYEQPLNLFNDMR